MSAMLTADWFMLARELYFRKFEIYPMDWYKEINMDNVVAAVAPYGGPIAVKRDETKCVKVQSGGNVIAIYSGFGKLIASIKCTGPQVVKIGWTNEEQLICVQEDGLVCIYNMFGKFLRRFAITQKVHNIKVIDAKIFTTPKDCTGIAIMTSSFKIFFVNNISEPKERQLADLPKSNLFLTSWTVIPKELTEVFIARERELYRLKQDEYNVDTLLELDISHRYTSILDMAVSLNAKHVALFSDAGYLWLGSCTLNTKYCEIDTNIILRPKHFIWCGTEAVVMFWETNSTLLICSKQGEKISFTYDGSLHLMPEVDGARVITTMQHELIQKVPDVVQKIFRINSTEPGSFLLEASKQFQKRSHRADEYMSLVKDNLTEAVEQCIAAAGYEFDPDVQKMLIRAAQFGKCFVANIDPEHYVKMCRILRVLNAVRHHHVGIPITFEQLKCQGHKQLLDRLVARQHYCLAIEIAKYLKMPDKDGSSRILVHWAKYKVEFHNTDNDEQLAKQIALKLGYSPYISYSEIANTAKESGKSKLAIKLLEFESKSSKQVDLLLKLEENEQALVKAIESGNTDLLYTVILKLKDSMPLGKFKMMIPNFPVAFALYKKYMREHNLQQLHEMYLQQDDFNSLGELELLKHLNSNTIQTNDASLWSTLETYKKAHNDLYVSICDENLKLVKAQRNFEEKYRKTFVGLSAHDTCKRLLELEELKAAEKFKLDFKIPDRRFWWLRIQCLADKDKWAELDKFSKLKKSPIGYAPFVDVCLQKNKDDEAAKYLPKVNEELKIKYYVKANKLEEAAQVAFEQKDIQGLLQVQSKCPPQSTLSEQINGYISQLGTRKGQQSSIPLFS